MLQWLVAPFSPEGRARQLGMAMLADPVIRPYLEEVEHYPEYARFIRAHRAHWEQSEHFGRCYQERLFAIAEHRATRTRAGTCDSACNWDLWYHQVVEPLKDIMWQTWEQRVQLQAHYNEAYWARIVRTAAEDTGNRGPGHIQAMGTMPNSTRHG